MFRRPLEKDEIKSMLMEPTKSIEFSEINRNIEDRLSVKSGQNYFECFLLNSGIKKLNVFLSAVGNPETGYPRFHRPTWSKVFNGVCLFVDDPARKSGNFAPAFFFGNKKNSVLSDLKNIIERIQDRFGIENKNLTFISSSNGGFASLYLCDLFRDSSCIALNPIISVSRYLQSVKKLNDFEQAFGVDLKTTDRTIQQRAQVFRIIDNRRSHFFVYANIRSRTDKIVIEGLFNKLKSQYKLGLNIISENLWIWIVDIPGENPHLVQPNEFICKYIDELMKSEISNEYLDDEFATLEYELRTQYGV